MKIAFCLHGISSGLNHKHGGLPVSFRRESELFKKNIFCEHDVDVFFHTWTSENHQNVLSTYQPKDYLIEDKKVFKSPNVLDYVKDLFLKVLGRNLELNRINNIHSRWYSFRKVIELVNHHSLKNSIDYDLVVITRFDLSVTKEIRLDTLNKNKFYTGDWVGYKDCVGNEIPEENIFNSNEKCFEYKRGFPHNNEGLVDFIFISNLEKMNLFSELYENIDKYIALSTSSNHKIALLRIKDELGLESLEFKYKNGSDYQLSRWIKDEKI